MLLPPELTAEKPMWEMGLWAAAEQTKEAPLGLQASERILKQSEHVPELPLSSSCLKHNTWLRSLPLRPCKTGCTVKEGRIHVLRQILSVSHLTEQFYTAQTGTALWTKAR